jgi:hypothetical protein
MNQASDRWRADPASAPPDGDVSDATAARRDPRLLAKLAGVFAVWVVLRVVFFEGLWGYDDLYHVNWATHPRVPVDVWEARVLYNGLLWLSRAAFGFHEWVFALPTMLASLMIAGTAAWAARRLYGDTAAVLAALLVATMAGDVIRASDPMANPLGAGFAAIGTALLVTGRGRRALVGAGVALGFSVYSHLATLFYVGPVALAWALHDRPRQRWREAFLVLAVAGVTSLALETGVMWVTTGKPLLHLELVKHTHLEIQQYVIAPHLADGAWNPEWFTWPFVTYFFSKDWALFLSLPVLLTLVRWRRTPPAARFLALAVLIAWAWLSFGTQHPLAYAPLDHQTRYWHALVLPAVLLAVHAYRATRRRMGRVALLGALVLPMPLILLSSGPWGQNVEISRELLAHAEAHPEQVFATDPYSYDEMYVLNGCAPPSNVTVLAGFPAPEFHRPGPEQRLDPSRPDVQVLFNALNMGRVRTADFERYVDEHLVRRPIAPAAYRLIAALLPRSMREQHAWFVRKPAAEIAVRPAMPGRE